MRIEIICTHGKWSWDDAEKDDFYIKFVVSSRAVKREEDEKKIQDEVEENC